METIRELKSRLDRLPRVRLTALPTPLEELDRLAKALGGPRFLIKRDDTTTLALGGNKTRKLEFALGDAIKQGADVIVTGGALQSNHCRLTAAATARLGLGCVLVVNGDPNTPPQGNLLLDRLFGAEIRYVHPGTPADVDRAIPQVAEELRAQGRRPYTMYVVGGSDSVFGVLGYVQAYVELAEQLEQARIQASHLCVCTGSGSTHAGLLLGAKLLGHSSKVLGMSIRRSREELESRVRDAVAVGAATLGCPVPLIDADVRVYDEFVGPAYGAMTNELRKAIHLLAQTSGILIDHVYAGKAFAGLLELIDRRTLGEGDVVVFVHTGGIPALFACPDQLLPA